VGVEGGSSTTAGAKKEWQAQPTDWREPRRRRERGKGKENIEPGHATSSIHGLGVLSVNNPCMFRFRRKKNQGRRGKVTGREIRGGKRRNEYAGRQGQRLTTFFVSSRQGRGEHRERKRRL